MNQQQTFFCRGKDSKYFRIYLPRGKIKNVMYLTREKINFQKSFIDNTDLLMRIMAFFFMGVGEIAFYLLGIQS